jgi:hypothetical protein
MCTYLNFAFHQNAQKNFAEKFAILILNTADHIILKSYQCIFWRDSISRPIAPVSSVAGGDVTTRPRRYGKQIIRCDKIKMTTTLIFKKNKKFLYKIGENC